MKKGKANNDSNNRIESNRVESNRVNWHHSYDMWMQYNVVCQWTNIKSKSKNLRYCIMVVRTHQCRIFHREPWSKEVNEVMTTANLLQIHLSSLQTNIDCSRQIRQKQRLLKQEIDLPPEIKEAMSALRLAQKKCRQLIEQRRKETTAIEDEQEAAFVAMNPEMDAKRAAQIFQRARDTKEMMSELPSKMNCPGGILSC